MNEDIYDAGSVLAVIFICFVDVIGIMLFIYLIIKLIKFYCKNETELPRINIPNRLIFKPEAKVNKKYQHNPPTDIDKCTPEEITCSICMNKKINTYVLDCEHSCMCSICSTKIMETSKKCPLCRKEIKLGIKNMFI